MAQKLLGAVGKNPALRTSTARHEMLAECDISDRNTATVFEELAKTGELPEEQTFVSLGGLAVKGRFGVTPEEGIMCFSKASEVVQLKKDNEVAQIELVYGEELCRAKLPDLEVS